MNRHFLFKAFRDVTSDPRDIRFLAEICDKFSHVEAGIRRFDAVEPALRPKEAHVAAKTLLRSGWKRIGVPDSDIQNVGEHTDGCLIIADYLSDAGTPLHTHLIQMLTVHDNITEPVTGDFTPHDPIQRHEKSRLENLVMRFMMAGTPNGYIQTALLTEFEDGITPTAQLANDIDKLEMCAQAGIYGKRYPHMKEKLDEFWDYAKPRMKTLLGRAYYLTLKSTKTLDSMDRNPPSP